MTYSTGHLGCGEPNPFFIFLWRQPRELGKSALPRYLKEHQERPRQRAQLSRPPRSGAWAIRSSATPGLRSQLAGLRRQEKGSDGPRRAPPDSPPPHLNTPRRRVRRARRGLKMAACGRVRRMFRLSAALQLLLLAAAGADKLQGQGGHSPGQGPGANLLPLGGQPGGGALGGQLQLPQSSQFQQQQQQQQPPQQPQPPFPAGGSPARRGGSGPGGAGGGWKLAEEESCREDVTRVCPKHTWSNNLAVLECLQDVREVRRQDGAGRSRPATGPRVSPALEAADDGLLLLSLPLSCARSFPLCPSLPGAFQEGDPTPTFHYLWVRGSGTQTPAPGCSRRRPRACLYLLRSFVWCSKRGGSSVKTCLGFCHPFRLG